MPYITASAKKKDLPENAGELTYAIQQILKVYLEGTGLRYQYLAECLGALEGAKIDLVSRIIAPYEKIKCAQNGDVWPSHLISDIYEVPYA